MKRKRDEGSDSFNDRSSPNKASSRSVSPWTEAEEQMVAPYEPRVFPLSDEEYNKMMAQETPMPPPHPVAGPSLESSTVSAATSRTNFRASSVLEVSKYDHLPWEKIPGMLLEVNLRNFMCHEKYRFEPNQRLNFLTGENGSGKSAVLTAIVFGLGGTARTSNRGSSNKAFIRTGQSSAMVEIRLHNAGEKEYRPDLYGESIIVQRVVTNSSSTYKLKDHDGKIVVDKKVKDELDRILLNFNIQVENPIAVLNQDTAKTFLFACEPYKFFMRATQLDQVKADYAVAAAETSAANALLKDKIESMPELKKENNENLSFPDFFFTECPQQNCPMIERAI